MARVIFYGADPMAIAAERLYLLPPLDQQGLTSPLGRFVAVMGLYAHLVEEGELLGPYDPERAERYAREALIDEREMRRLSHLADSLLADRFQVPIEQVHFRRDDLGLSVSDAGNNG